MMNDTINIDYQRLARCIVNELRNDEAIVNTQDLAEVQTSKDRLCSGVEAAEILGCSPARITKLRQAHRIKYTVVGNVAKYPYKEIMRIKRMKY